MIKGYPESKVLKLLNLGFSIDEVVKALDQALGND